MFTGDRGGSRFTFGNQFTVTMNQNADRTQAESRTNGDPKARIALRKSNSGFELIHENALVGVGVGGWRLAVWRLAVGVSG